MDLQENGLERKDYPSGRETTLRGTLCTQRATAVRSRGRWGHGRPADLTVLGKWGFLPLPTLPLTWRMPGLQRGKGVRVRPGRGGSSPMVLCRMGLGQGRVVRILN